MENTSYVNHYIEILTSTMNDAILRNVSLQANLRIHEESINNIQKKFEEKITEKDNEIASLKNEINNQSTKLIELNNMRQEFDNTKHQVQHLETFRNELHKERQIVEQLRNELEELKTPIKKTRKPKVLEVSTEVTNFTQKDGGSF